MHIQTQKKMTAGGSQEWWLSKTKGVESRVALFGQCKGPSVQRILPTVIPPPSNNLLKRGDA